jgi:hypothetical protein
MGLNGTVPVDMMVGSLAQRPLAPGLISLAGYARDLVRIVS